MNRQPAVRRNPDGTFTVVTNPVDDWSGKESPVKATGETTFGATLGSMLLAMFAPKDSGPKGKSPSRAAHVGHLEHPVRKAQGRPGDADGSPGRSPSGGHWVTMHGRHVYLDDHGCYHFAGKDSPAIDPDAPDFLDRVADSLSHGAAHGASSAGIAIGTGHGSGAPSSPFALRHLTGASNSLRHASEADATTPRFPAAHLHRGAAGTEITTGFDPDPATGVIGIPSGSAHLIAADPDDPSRGLHDAARHAAGLLVSLHAQALHAHAHAHRERIAGDDLSGRVRPGSRLPMQVLTGPGPSPAGDLAADAVAAGLGSVMVPSARPVSQALTPPALRDASPHVALTGAGAGLDGDASRAEGRGITATLDTVLGDCLDVQLPGVPDDEEPEHASGDGAPFIRRMLRNARTGDRVVYEQHALEPGGGNPAVGWRIRHVHANHGTVHVATDPDAGHVIGRGSQEHARALAGAVMLGAITGTSLPVTGWPGEVGDRPGAGGIGTAAGMPARATKWSETRRLGWALATALATSASPVTSDQLARAYREAASGADGAGSPLGSAVRHLAGQGGGQPGTTRPVPAPGMPVVTPSGRAEPPAVQVNPAAPDPLRDRWPAWIGGSEDLGAYFRPALRSPDDVRTIRQAMGPDHWDVRLGDAIVPDAAPVASAERNGLARPIPRGRTLLEVMNRPSGMRTIAYWTQERPPGGDEDTPRAFRIKVIDRDGMVLSESQPRLVVPPSPSLPPPSPVMGMSGATPNASALVAGSQIPSEHRLGAVDVIASAVQAANWAASFAGRRAQVSASDARARTSPVAPAIFQPSGAFDPARPAPGRSGDPAAHHAAHVAGLPVRPVPFALDDAHFRPEAVGDYLRSAFPGLATRDTQNSPHAGNSVIDHTVLGLDRLASPGLSARDTELLRLAFAFHDVGKLHGGRDPLHQEYSAQTASDHLGDFGLSPDERMLVTTLIRHHHAVGDFHMARPAPTPVGTHGSGRPVRYPGGMDVTELARNAGTPRIARLMARMWATDVAGIPGYHGVSFTSPGNAPSTNLIQVADQTAALASAEIARLDAAGSHRPHDTIVTHPPVSTAPPPAPPVPGIAKATESGVSCGEVATRRVHLRMREPNSAQDNLPVSALRNTQALSGPDLSHARAFGMAYDGPTGQIIPVTHLVDRSRVKAIRIAGVRPASGLWGVMPAGEPHGSPIPEGMATIKGTYHAGRTCTPGEALFLRGRWELTHPAEATLLASTCATGNLELDRATALACLEHGYASITATRAGKPILIGLDPARYRLDDVDHDPASRDTLGETDQ